MGKKDDGNDNNDSIAINCNGNGAVIPVLATVGTHAHWRD
jgi:hypothetical protein